MAQAAGWTPITGSGSTWSANAVQSWQSNVAANYGMQVNFNANGSSAGRQDFINKIVDFAISEIPFQAHPEDLAFAKMFWKLSAGLVADGKIRVHPPRVGKDGLRGVLDGYQAMREGQVSGEKLVYRIEDTP